MNSIEFFVPGKPGTAGSKRSFIAKTGKVVTKDDCKDGPAWRADVRSKARDAMKETHPGQFGRLLDGPILLLLTFSIARPKGHYRSGKNSSNLRPSAPAKHTQKPDVVKMARAIEDALTKVIWRDDSQVWEEILKKEWGTQSGATIIIQW